MIAVAVLVFVVTRVRDMVLLRVTVVVRSELLVALVGLVSAGLVLAFPVRVFEISLVLMG